MAEIVFGIGLCGAFLSFGNNWLTFAVSILIALLGLGCSLSAKPKRLA